MSLPPDAIAQTPTSDMPAVPASTFAGRLSGKHTAYSATLLLMASSVLSGLLGLARTKYIAHVFGAGSATDAYNAAFNLPDMINYFLVGGVASITLVNILNPHR